MKPTRAIDRDDVEAIAAAAADALEEAPGSTREGKLREHADRLHVRALDQLGRDDVIAKARATRQLPAEQRALLATGARAELARRWLYHFFRYSWPLLEPDTPLELNWHHKLLCDHVQGQLDDWKRNKRNPAYRIRAQNGAYNFAPGTTKSRIISVAAPSWMWTSHPSWSVMCVSANPIVATRDAMFTRDIVTSDWFIASFGVTWTIRDDADARGNYRNTAGGSRVSLGITSRVIGVRFDALIIDDANDMFEVFSEAKRREVNGKIDHALWNRVNDQRACIRIEMQQRGHVDDATGHLIAKIGTNPRTGGIMHVPVPIEFDPTLKVETPYGYKDPRTVPGESLHPARFTAEFLAAERLRLGTFGFEAQYNQRPAPLEGNALRREHFRFFKLASANGARPSRPPGCVDHDTAPAQLLRNKPSGVAESAHWTLKLDLDWICVSVDASFGSTSQSASQVAIIVVGGKGALRYVLDDRTRVMDTNDMLDEIARVVADYPAARRVLVERKANGQAILDLFRRRFPGFIAIDPQGGKIARANAMVPTHEAGNIMLLDGAPWVAAHVEELSMFPNGPYDDRVDAMSQLISYAEQKLTVAAAWTALSR